MSNIISNGTYKAEVISSCLSKSKDKGTYSVKFLFNLICNIVDEETTVQGQIYGDLWLTEKTFDNTMKTLVEVFGFQGTDLSVLNSTTLFTGILCEIVVENEPFTNNSGATRLISKVKFINPVDSGFRSLKALPESDLLPVIDSLNARLFAFSSSYQNVKPKNKGIEARDDYEKKEQELIANGGALPF